TVAQMEKIKDVCAQNNLLLHLDGSRLFNALILHNDTPEQYGKIFQSITICLSKGLGCPAGALLVGNKTFIKKARRIRKVFGGGMRQAGILAAAGVFALQNNRERLAVDHMHAKMIAELLQQLPYVDELFPVHTNILIFHLHNSVSDSDFVAFLQSNKILSLAIGGNYIRFVTHMDILESMLPVILRTLQQYNNIRPT
ncbi:MAG: threonine aldolase family protein, partial [Chitinophagales bacterium]